LALNGFDDEQVKEAGWVAQSVAGASAYLYSLSYDQKRFRDEVDRMLEHIRAHR